MRVDMDFISHTDMNISLSVLITITNVMKVLQSCKNGISTITMFFYLVFYALVTISSPFSDFFS